MTVLHTSRVLLVDDTEQNRYVLSRILARAGLEVEQCTSGKDALERVKSHPDLVILDVKLPDISGYEVCRRIKSDPVTRAIPVLQISASFVSNESKVQALEGGADGYLTHPIDATVLVATVKSLLRLKQAELISRQSAQQWQSTVDALPEYLVLLDTDNKVLRCNRAFVELSGKSFGEVIGHDGVTILKQVLGSADSITHTKTSRYVSEQQHGANWFLVTADAVMTAEQQFGSIVVITNITERKLAEETLRHTEKLAATGRLAQTIAHEINNPLEALTNLIYLSSHSGDVKEIQGFLQQATTELERVAKITKQILSFHRETKVAVELDFQDMVQSVLALYVVQMEAKHVAVDLPKAPPFSIYGFPGELRQVFANLIGNAIDASPNQGCLRIRIRAGSLENVAGVVFTIHDEGPGIPRNLRNRVLEPFFTTKELKGTGLGLWLANSLVVKHRGSLRFRSRRASGGAGTCFRVFLPIGSSSESKTKPVQEKPSPTWVKEGHSANI